MTVLYDAPDKGHLPGPGSGVLMAAQGHVGQKIPEQGRDQEEEGEESEGEQEEEEEEQEENEEQEEQQEEEDLNRDGIKKRRERREEEGEQAKQEEYLPVMDDTPQTKQGQSNQLSL